MAYQLAGEHDGGYTGRAESIPQRTSIPSWYTKGGGSYAVYETGQAERL